MKLSAVGGLDGAAFVGVPSAEQGDVGLLAVGVDVGLSVGQEVAVDHRAEVGRRGSGLGSRGLQQLVGREVAQVEELAGAEDALGPGDAEGLGLLPERQGIAGAVEARAALADGFGEEAIGDGRGHQGADRLRAGGFAEDGDVGRVAPEGGDVAADPGDGEGLVHQAIVAGGLVG